MNSEKFESSLNLSLDATESELEKSLNLSVGIDMENNTWELIIRYAGDIEKSLREIISEYEFVELSLGYGIIYLKKKDIDKLGKLPEIIYVEKPKSIYFSERENLITEKSSSCILPMTRKNGENLSGENVMISIIDSGIELNEERRKHIFAIWDQTDESGISPSGYNMGSFYDESQIKNGEVKTTDISGHGTYIYEIIRSIAPGAKIVIVKMALANKLGFPRTTELMKGVDFSVNYAKSVGLPIVLNISFGNTYGAHDGTSLLETFLDDMSVTWKNLLVCGAGNEGASAGHTEINLKENSEAEVGLFISSFETMLNLQIWKKYQDDFDIEIISPDLKRIVLTSEIRGTFRYEFDGTELLIYYGSPLPYSRNQEIYIDFIAKNEYIKSGEWKFVFRRKNIAYGIVNMWLPQEISVNGTRFLRHTPNLSITIPSTSKRVMTVGAYDARLNGIADFSGRGYIDIFGNVKPEICAPGVGIEVENIFGTKSFVNGTSFAAPFVTGAAALLMEWGITRGNDSFLYGEKLKAYLIKGAKNITGFSYPNTILGWGALCASFSLP